VQVYMAVIVLIKSRQRTCESSEAQEDLAGRPVEDGGDMCQVAGEAYGVRYSQRVSRVWASNLGGGSEERTTCGDIEELASRLSYLMKGAVAVESRLCQVRQECPYG
jgi:hypothetical protein